MTRKAASSTGGTGHPAAGQAATGQATTGRAATGLLARAAGLLLPGGLAAIEIGSDQADSAAALFRAAGLQPVLAHDLAGRPRALLIQVKHK